MVGVILLRGCLAAVMLCSIPLCLQPQTHRPHCLLSPPLRYCLHGSLQAPASKVSKTPPAPKRPPLRRHYRYRRVFHFTRPIETCNELQVDPSGIFKFSADIDFESSLEKEAIRDIKVTWNVVLKGWKAIFNMMESCSGKASFVPEAEDLFSREVPLPGCCSEMVTASSLVAEIKLGFCSENCIGEEDIKDDGKFRRLKLSLAIMNTKHWRYLSMDDALRHLQHFLLPCMLNQLSSPADHYDEACCGSVVRFY